MIKKLIYLLIPLVVVVAILSIPPAAPVPQNGAGQPGGQQITTTNGVITMLPSTMPVAQAVQNRVMDLLTPAAPARGVFVYAITDVAQRNGYYYVSVSGQPIGSTAMHLQNSIWLGSIQLVDVAGLPGLVVDLQPSQPVDSTNLVKSEINTGSGGSGAILPFRNGTTAQYGISGVHDCGFSLNGWKAVDFFPSENMVYSSLAGEINYVCRDSTQVALRIGDNLYTHLADTGQLAGDRYTQGQPISGMVPGTFDDTCGVADQNPGTYHVHFCFQPTAHGTIFNADGYTLNVLTEDWTKGADTISPLGYLTADWANAGVVVRQSGSGNIWDSTVGGVNSMVNNTINILPAHIDMGMGSKVLGSAGPAFDLMYTVVLANFNLTVPLWVLGIIVVLETVRIAYAGWMWVKKAIPIIG